MYKAKLFISYSHKDRSGKEKFEEHLKTLVRLDQVIVWSDAELLPGQNFKQEIANNLLSSDIVIFLVSESFINSDFSYNEELKKVLKRAEQKEVFLVSIILRKCPWTLLPISAYQALPHEGKPIEEWEHQGEAFKHVIEELQKTVLLIIKSFESSREGRAQKIENEMSAGNLEEACNDLMSLARDFESSSDKAWIKKSTSIKTTFSFYKKLTDESKNQLTAAILAAHKNLIEEMIDLLYEIRLGPQQKAA